MLVGLSLTEHLRSLVLRRTNKEASQFVGRYVEILGGRDGWNGQESQWKLDNRVIDIGGCQHEDDKQKRKGTPHDFIGFDEVSDFSETQYKFITIWNRTTVPGQRCRIVAAGNPPTRPEGFWVLRRWAAWLDPTHHNPAKPGELRWYTTGKDEDGQDAEIEVQGRGPHIINGEEVYARSRTFIPASLSDNPYQDTPEYRANLASLDPAARAAYRDGDFTASVEDDPFQVIPTAWIRAAQDRWKPYPPEGIPMCAISTDPCGGGKDKATFSRRHDGWFDKIIAIPGEQVPYGQGIAGQIITLRRDDASVVIDMGGGYGNVPYTQLKENGIDATCYLGSNSSSARTADRKLRFYNKRAETYWRFREALDPSQPGGSDIALPADPELVADLTAPTYSTESGCIKLESKKDLVKRLGRSPDRGDAVVNCWSEGNRAATAAHIWMNANTHARPRGRTTQVNRGYAQRKKR